MRFRRWCPWSAVLLLAATAWCGDYQVVLKGSGKIVHGDLLAEDAGTVTLQVGTGEVVFKKEKLDLERMRRLNATQHVPAGASLHQPPLPHDVALATIRKLERQIAEREEALARLQAELPSDERDRKVHEAEEELRLMRSARQDLKLEYGVSQDTELERLFKVRAEAATEAEAAQRAYDNLPPGTPQPEVDAKWAAFREAEKKWQEAHAALTKAMKEKQ
jgi:hypothetical protein